MKKFIDMFKGMAVGLANVVAGLSGGTVAVILKAYDKMIDLFSNIIKHPIVTIKKHWMFIIGISIGILGGAVLLERLYSFAPLPVSLLFCGIVITGFIKMSKECKENHGINKKGIIGFIIAFLIMIGLPFITSGADKNLGLNIVDFIILICVGAVAAAAMIIPGVSGSMILASSGYYDTTLKLVSDFVEACLHLDFSMIGQLIIQIIFFGIGCLIGLVGCAALIKTLFKKFKTICDFTVLGFVFGSVFAMIIVVLLDKNNNYLFNSSKGIWMWICGILLFIIGLYLGSLLNKVSEGDDMDKLNEEFLTRASTYKDEWISLTSKLVSYNSVLDEYNENSDAPFGRGNKEVLNFMLEHALQEGFEVYNCDNYAGHISFGEGEETLGILAHLDVVPAVGKWTNDPFCATLSTDGTRLTGRGVNDDKGPLAASYIALKILRDMNIIPNKKILLIMGCDEETGSRCLEHYFSVNPMPEIGFSPDACFPCINGEKVGIHYDIEGEMESHIVSFYAGERYNIVPDEAKMTLDINLEKEYLKFLEENNYKGEVKDGVYIAYGVSAHAMSPQKGKNAAFILFEFLNKYTKCPLSEFMLNYMINDFYGEKLGINVYHDEMKELTQNVGIVKIENGNVFIGVDVRCPVENHVSLMQTQLDKALYNTGLTAKVEQGGKLHFVPKDSYLVKTLMSAYKDITNDNVNESYTIGGGTYAKFIDNAVAFGPQFIGREDVDHQADEYVYVDDFIKTIAIYTNAIYRLVTDNETKKC